MTTEEVKEIVCECGRPKTEHEMFKGRLICLESNCLGFKERASTSQTATNQGQGDWFADIVEAGLEGIAKHLVNKAKGRIK